MHPILWTLVMSAGTARGAGIAASILLSIFIVWDGRAKLVSAAVQGILFFAISMTAAIVLLTPERLPAEISIDIRSWGIAAIVGMCACFLIQRWLGREIGLASDKIFSLWVYGGLAGIVGARGLQVAVNWQLYQGQPLAALAFWDGGMVYIGGVVAALLVAIFYAKKHQMGLRAFDVLALGVALTQGVGRIGCFLAGCCYGRETTLPWGTHFPVGSIAHAAFVASGELPPDSTMTAALHPTQLYEAIACFAIGGALLLWYRRKNPAPGMIVCGYFLLYSVVRFMLELLRNDPDRQFLVRIPESSPVLLSTSQTAGIILMAIALIIARRLSVAEVQPQQLRSFAAIAANDDK